MDKFDFIASFYKDHHTREGFIRRIDSLLISENLSAIAIPFGSYIKPKEIFAKIMKLSRKNKLISENEGIQLYELAYKFKEGNHEKEASGRFFIYEPSEYKNVYVAITIAGSNFYRRALLPFIQSLYPKVILTFITHKKLRKLLDDFQIKYQFKKLVITRASYRLRFEEEEKSEKIVPMVSWPNMDLKEAFDWVYQNNGWFQSLQFRAKGDSLYGTRISFTRQGITQADGLFQKAFDSFVMPVCKTIYENIEFFGKRSRRENKDLQARPLIIDFGTDQFQDVSENKKFIQAIRRLRTASTSVLHGNPYIHMSVIDYFDGSTFDLWVLNSKQLFIVPQMKGTIAGIKRLISHIFDSYAEGEIKDYSEDLDGTSK